MQVLWPRAWDAYRKTDHFWDAIEDESRHLSVSQVKTTLAYGQQLPNDGDAERAFQYYDNGIYTYVLVGWNDDRSHRVLITAWNSIRNPIEAVTDGRTVDEIGDIYEFNDREEPIDVAYPIYHSLFCK